MKVGSKAYVMLMRKIFWTNISLFLFLLTLKFMISGSVFGKEHGVINFILIVHLVIFLIFELLAIFHTERGKANWSLVYPQLRRKMK